MFKKVIVLMFFVSLGSVLFAQGYDNTWSTTETDPYEFSDKQFDTSGTLWIKNWKHKNNPPSVTVEVWRWTTDKAGNKIQVLVIEYELAPGQSYYFPIQAGDEVEIHQNGPSIYAIGTWRWYPIS